MLSLSASSPRHDPCFETILGCLLWDADTTRARWQVLAEGSMTVDEIHAVSKIDHWFLRRLERIANFSKVMEVREIGRKGSREWATIFFLLFLRFSLVFQKNNN